MALPGEEIPERCHWQHAFDAWEVFLRKFGGRASLDLHGICSKGSQSWSVENMNVLVLVEQVHLHDVTVASQLSQAPATFFPPPGLGQYHSDPSCCQSHAAAIRRWMQCIPSAFGHAGCPSQGLPFHCEIVRVCHVQENLNMRKKRVVHINIGQPNNGIPYHKRTKVCGSQGHFESPNGPQVEELDSPTSGEYLPAPTSGWPSPKSDSSPPFLAASIPIAVSPKKASSQPNGLPAFNMSSFVPPIPQTRKNTHHRPNPHHNPHPVQGT